MHDIVTTESYGYAEHEVGFELLTSRVVPRWWARVGAGDTATGITLVALGTSLPDAVASLHAVQGDDSADVAH